jgi:hypothetical protein
VTNAARTAVDMFRDAKRRERGKKRKQEDDERRSTKNNWKSNITLTVTKPHTSVK